MQNQIFAAKLWDLKPLLGKRCHEFSAADSIFTYLVSHMGGALLSVFGLPLFVKREGLLIL